MPVRQIKIGDIVNVHGNGFGIVVNIEMPKVRCLDPKGEAFVTFAATARLGFKAESGLTTYSPTYQEMSSRIKKGVHLEFTNALNQYVESERGRVAEDVALDESSLESNYARPVTPGWK